MSRQYSSEEKAAALATLDRNHGNIPFTALQLSIPERTLYTWRRRWYAESQQKKASVPPPLPISAPTFENDHSFFDFLRQQIMDELARLAGSFQEVPNITSPRQRALILTQLLDRLIKLDDHLKPYQPRPHTIFRVVGSEGEEPYGRPKPQQTSPSAEGSSVHPAGDSFPPERDSGL